MLQPLTILYFFIIQKTALIYVLPFYFILSNNYSQILVILNMNPINFLFGRVLQNPHFQKNKLTILSKNIIMS